MHQAVVEEINAHPMLAEGRVLQYCGYQHSENVEECGLVTPLAVSLYTVV